MTVEVVPFVATTANIAGGLSRPRALRAVEIALEGTDVAVVQEMQRRDASTFVDRRVFGTLQGPHPGPKGRCAIYYRLDRLRPMRVWNPVLHLSTLYPSARRYFIAGTFRDLATGRRMTVIVVHFGPHSDDDAGGITKLPRGRLVTTGITVLVRFVTAISVGQVFVGGDWNIALEADLKHRDPSDLIERFDAAGLQLAGAAKKLTPTHGRHTYDGWFYRLTRWAGVALGVVTLHDGPGDHLAVRGTWDMSVRKAWAAKLARKARA